MLLGVVVATLCAAPLTSTAPAHAQGLEVEPGSDVLGFTGSFTYTVDPTSGVVHAELETDIQALGQSPESIWDCWRYFDFVVPTTITNIVNRGYTFSNEGTPIGGSVLDARTKPIEGTTAYQFLRVEMMQCMWGDPRLHSYTRVTFDLPGAALRSDDTSRVNAAFVGFNAIGMGYPTGVTIKVVVPDSFTAIGLTVPWTSATVGGVTTYSLAPAEQLNSPNTYFSAADEDALVAAEVDSESPFHVMHWPDDAEWGQFVADEVDRGVPALTEAIGMEWPMDTGTEIVESYASTVDGTPGSFDHDSNAIEIGEDLDGTQVLQQLAYAWFNDHWFSERWINEGFAQTFAAIATRDLGDVAPQPPAVTSDAPGALPLTMWSDPFFGIEDTIATEWYGHDASYYLINRLIEEIGADKMREVLRMVASGATPYSGDVEEETWNDQIDWKEFLDLLEIVGGSDKARDLFEDLVVGPASEDLLQLHQQSRETYDELVARGAQWAAPVGVRRSMHEWDFETFDELSAAANTTLDLRDQLTDLCAARGISFPSNLEAAYEAAVDVDDLIAVQDLTSSYIAGDPAGANEADADTQQSQRGLFDSATASVLTAALALVLIAMIAFVWLRRRGRRRAESAQSEVPHMAEGDNAEVSIEE